MLRMPVVVSVDERGACFGARASRYRKYKLSEETDLVVRCELDGVMNYKGQDQLLSIKALNEFDPKITGARHDTLPLRAALKCTRSRWARHPTDF